MKTKRVVVDPRVWDDYEKMDDEGKAEMKKILGIFERAAANLPEDATPEQFNAELTRLSAEEGQEVEIGPLDPDTLTEEQLAEIMTRDTPVVRH